MPSDIFDEIAPDKAGDIFDQIELSPDDFPAGLQPRSTDAEFYQVRRESEARDARVFEGTDAPVSSIVRQKLADPALSLAKGVVALPESLVGLVDIPTLGRYGKYLENSFGYKPKETKEFIEEFYSPEQKAANKEVAEAKGFFRTVEAMGENPSTIVNTVAESLPSMLGGAAIGRGLITKASPLVAGAIGEGAISAGQTAEQLRQESEDGTLSGKQAVLSATTGIGTGLIGILGGGLARRLGVTDIDTLLAGGKSTAAAKKNVLLRVVGSALTEGFLEELPQSAQERIQQNVASDRPWDEGVAEASATGLLAGIVMGGAGGFAQGSSPIERTEFFSTAEPPVSDPMASSEPSETEIVAVPLQQASGNRLRPNRKVSNVITEPVVAAPTTKSDSVSREVQFWEKKVEFWKQYGPSPDLTRAEQYLAEAKRSSVSRERVISVANKYSNGEIRTGTFHALIEAPEGQSIVEGGDGFITNKGRFVNREEAAELMGLAHNRAGSEDLSFRDRTKDDRLRPDEIPIWHKLFAEGKTDEEAVAIIRESRKTGHRKYKESESKPPRDGAGAPAQAATASELEVLETLEAEDAMNKTQKARLKELRKAVAVVEVVEPEVLPSSEAPIEIPIYMDRGSVKGNVLASVRWDKDPDTGLYVINHFKIRNPETGVYDRLRPPQQSKGFNTPQEVEQAGLDFIRASFPAKPPATAPMLNAPTPVLDLSDQVAAMSGPEFSTWAKAQPGGFTTTAYTYGKTLTPEQQVKAREASAAVDPQIAAALAAEDAQGMADLTSKKQFFSEALEAASGATLAKPKTTKQVAKAKGEKSTEPAPRVLDTSGTAAFGSAFDDRIGAVDPVDKKGDAPFLQRVLDGRGEGKEKSESKRTLVLRNNETGELREVSIWDNNGAKVVDPDAKKSTGTDALKVLRKFSKVEGVTLKWTPVASLRYAELQKGVNRPVTEAEFAALKAEHGAAVGPTDVGRQVVQGVTEEGDVVQEVVDPSEGAPQPEPLSELESWLRAKLQDKKTKKLKPITPDMARDLAKEFALGEPESYQAVVIEIALPLAKSPDFLALSRDEKADALVDLFASRIYEFVARQYKEGQIGSGLPDSVQGDRSITAGEVPAIEVSSDPTAPVEQPAPVDEAASEQAVANEAEALARSNPTQREALDFLERADAKLAELQSRLRGKSFTGIIGVEPAILDAAITIARGVLRSTNSIARAVQRVIDEIRRMAPQAQFDEVQARGIIEAELQAAPSPSGTTQDNSQAIDLLSDPEVVGEINKALNDGQRRGWVKTKIYNAYDYVLDRMQLTPELRAAAQAETRTLLNEAGFSDTELEQAGSLLKLRDEAESRGGNGEFPLETAAQNLLTIIQRELAAGRDRAPLIQLLLDSVRVYFGNDSITSISQPTKDALKSYTQGEKSLQGLLLGMSSNASKTVQYVGRNVKDVLRQVYTQRFGEDGSVARILRAAFEAFKLAITPAAIRGALNSEAAVALYRLAGDKSSELPDMVQKALDAPFYSQNELAQRFTAILAERVGGLTDAQKAQSVASFNAALKEAFRVGRVNAAGEVEAFLTSSGRRRKRKEKKSVWRAVEQAVNDGMFDPGAVLDATAIENGFGKLTPEIAARMKGWVQELQSVRSLPESERAKYANNPVGLARAEKAYEGFAIQRIVELKRKIETQWARLAIPLNIRTNSANVVQAAYEWASAVLLLKLGFPPRQVVDVTTQALIHGPTRSIMRAWNQIEANRDQNKPSDVPQEITAALIDGFGIQIRSAKQALIAMLATLKGTPRARNVEDLISRIALFERAEQKLQELVAKKDYKQAVPLWLFTQVRWGRTFAAATDNLIRIPAVFQEMRQQVVAELRKAGLGRAEAETMADDLVGDINTEWKTAILEAQRLDALAGTNYTPLQIKQAATDIVMKLAYQKMREQNMPADDFEARNNLLGDTLGWNEFEEGGVGGLVAAPLRALSNFGEAFPPAAIISVGLGRFSNAIAIGANRAAAFTPLGYFPKAFGVTEVDPKSGQAYDGSAFFRTAEDRRQRKIDASFGSAMSVVVISLVASGIAKVFWKPPKDPEERALWLRDHTPNTVEFSNADGSKVTVPLAIGPLRYVAPAFVGAGAWMDKVNQVAKQQAKMDAYADARGLARGKANGLSLADYLSVGVDAAFAALIGGRTAQGLVGSITDYGIPNLNKAAANLVGPTIPLVPAWQELARWSNIRIDPKTGTFFDFLVPLESSKSRQVNMLGDPVGSEDAARRVGLSIGLPYFSGSGQQMNPSYAALLNSEYRPPSINPAKAYDISGTYRPFNSDELQQYTELRGKYLKENLGAIGATADEGQARAAYSDANTRALSEVGVTTATTGRGYGGGQQVTGASFQRASTSRGSSSLGINFPRRTSGSRLGLGGSRIRVSAGSFRPSRSRLGGTRLPRIRAPRVSRVTVSRTRRRARRNRLRR